MPQPLPIDVLILGGGVAGLWTLDLLRRHGYAALLADPHALGHGQTIASQGIIHGGLKYMFDGQLTPPAKAISEMPPLWRACLAGQQEPNLAGTTLRSDSCHIWGTGSIKSRLFLTGSTIALRAAPQPVERADWPAPLAHVPGKILRVPEPVIDPATMLQRFADRNRNAILHTDPSRPPEFTCSPDGRLASILLHPHPEPPAPAHSPLLLRPATLILTAGEANADLRDLLGLSPAAMQRRPLHMVMLRGPLPPLFGHCVGGPKPRITITTAADSRGRAVWQVGGQIAEDGIHHAPPELIALTRKELAACIPALDLSGVEWATYRINRAEAATTTGQRPDDAHILQEANIITAWPTKLALAPRLAQRILETLPPPSAFPAQPLDATLPRPPIAQPPWETEPRWTASLPQDPS